MHLANQSYPADLLGVVAPVSSRGIGNSRNLKMREKGRRAAQKGKVTCDEPRGVAVLANVVTQSWVRTKCPHPNFAGINFERVSFAGD